ERKRCEQAGRAALEMPPPLRVAELEEQCTTEHHRVERHTGQERTITTVPGDTPQLAQVSLEREEVEPAANRDTCVEPFGTGRGPVAALVDAGQQVRQQRHARDAYQG